MESILLGYVMWFHDCYVKLVFTFVLGFQAFGIVPWLFKYMWLQGQVLALVGNQLYYGDIIRGVVLSICFNEYISSSWNCNASYHQVGIITLIRALWTLILDCHINLIMMVFMPDYDGFNGFN